MTPLDTVFVDIDTQADFMLPSGSLYVPGAIEIIPHLRTLFEFARERRIPILSSADAHPPDDPSFSEWPPHCVVGTPGQRRIPETLWPDPVIVPNHPRAFSPPAVCSGQTIVEKVEYDLASNPNFDAILSSLGERRFVVFGVATEYCVRGAVLALRKRGCKVTVVTDAIQAITDAGGRKAIEEMTAAGAQLVTTREVCPSLGAHA